MTTTRPTADPFFISWRSGARGWSTWHVILPGIQLLCENQVPLAVMTGGRGCQYQTRDGRDIPAADRLCRTCLRVAEHMKEGQSLTRARELAAHHRGEAHGR